MSNFPENIEKVINAIAKENRMVVKKETHYDAVNREMYWFEKNRRKRIDFALVNSLIVVTSYDDIFPVCPLILTWCHDYIPMFPLFAKIQWEKVDELLLGETEGYYHEKIKLYIRGAEQRHDKD